MIGLTTALKIQEQGVYQVTIIADVLPGDAKTIKYTSHWAVSVLETKFLRCMHPDSVCVGCAPHAQCQERRKTIWFATIFDLDGNLLTEIPELERDTFDVLWDLSKPDSSAEGYFLRITETIFFRGEGVRPPYEVMPDVSTICLHSTFHPV